MCSDILYSFISSKPRRFFSQIFCDRYALLSGKNRGDFLLRYIYIYIAKEFHGFTAICMQETLAAAAASAAAAVYFCTWCLVRYVPTYLRDAYARAEAHLGTPLWRLA